MIRKIALAVLFSGILSAAQNPAAEKEIMTAMNAFKVALIKKDVAAMDKLIHPELIYTHSDGVLIQDKQQWMDYVKAGATTVDIDWGTQRVRVYGTIAVATGHVEFRNPDGAPNPLRLVQVWSNEGGRWQLVSRQTTKVSPPAPTPAAQKQKK